MKKFIISVTAVFMALVGFSACSEGPDDADVVSHNISKAADNFEVQRRIVVQNGVTDSIIMVVEGRCNIVADEKESQLEITCKLGKDEFIKNYAGLSDNVFYFIEQSETIDVSEYHYRVTYKPQAIIPDPDFRGSTEDTPLSDENQQ